MKNFSVITAFALVFLMCLFSGCSKTENDLQSTLSDGSSSYDDPISDSDGHVFSGEIVQINDSSLLIAPENGDLCSLNVSELPLFNKDGSSITIDELETGMTVDITFSGSVMEIYPILLDSPEKLVVTGRSNGLVGLYFQAICDIIQVDSGLNSGISIVSVDLSCAYNLTSSQRAALAHMTGGYLGCEYLSLDYDELCKQGYIDNDNLIFNDGILIRITTENTDPDSTNFTFNTEKWRGGDGAVFYTDCTARFKNNEWIYTPGAFAIS